MKMSRCIHLYQILKIYNLSYDRNIVLSHLYLPHTSDYSSSFRFEFAISTEERAFHDFPGIYNIYKTTIAFLLVSD